MAYQYQKMIRAELDAGREIPLKGVPAALGDVAKGSVDASQRLYRRAQSRTYSIGFSLREMEAARAARQARTAPPAQKKAQLQPRAKRKRAKGSK